MPLALPGGTDLPVQRSGDGKISGSRGVLADHRCAGTVMAHPRLEVTQAGAGGGERVPGRPQVVDVQTRDAELTDRRQLPRVAAEVCHGEARRQVNR